MTFTEVKLEDALSDPQGFYAHYANINAASRRVVLIRVPRDFDAVAHLEGATLSFSPRQGPIALPEGEERDRHHYVLCPPVASNSSKEATLALAIPGSKALFARPIEEPIWTVTKCYSPSTRPEETASKRERASDGIAASPMNRIDFTKDLDGGIPITNEGKSALGKRKQPAGLTMNLSPVDMTTVIDRYRRRSGKASKSAKLQRAAS